MTRHKILKQAEEKRKLARRLLREGKTGPQIAQAIQKKFRSGIGHGIMVELRQELAEAQNAPEVVTLLPPAETTTLAPVEAQGELETRLGAIFNWMGEEGIQRIHLDLDSREVRLDRTEVIHC